MAEERKRGQDWWKIGGRAPADPGASPPAEGAEPAPELTVEELKKRFRVLDIFMALLFCGVLAAIWLNSMRRTMLGLAAEIGLILALAFVALAYSRAGYRRSPSAQGAAGVESLAWWAYLTAGLVVASTLVLSIFAIPLALGVLIWGIVTRKRGKGVLIGLGALGIVLPVGLVVYGLHYVMKPGGGWDQAQVMMVQNSLQTLVREIEFHKAQKGSYPAQLEDLAKTSTNALFLAALMTDFSQMKRGAPAMTNAPTYYYELQADKARYVLLARGADGTAYTADDVAPQLPEEERKNTGLLIGEPPAAAGQPVTVSNP